MVDISIVLKLKEGWGKSESSKKKIHLERFIIGGPETKLTTHYKE